MPSLRPGSISVARSAALVVAALLAVPEVTSAETLVNVAVLGFLGPKDQAPVLELLTDKARGAVADQLRGGGYRVLTREAMLAIIRENGGSCDEGACEVDTGRNLGAAMIISGQLSVYRGVFILTLKAHETATAGLVGALDARDGDALALVDKVPDLVRKLVELWIGSSAGGELPTPGAGARRASASGPAEVVVEFRSDPAGASVSVDGVILCPSTPCSRRIVSGMHQVSMAKERHREAREAVDVKRGMKVELKLRPIFGRVSVTTTPPGLPLRIAGQPAGKSPVTDFVVDPGTIEVAVDDPCYHRDVERVRIAASDRKSVAIKATLRTAEVKVSLDDHDGKPVDGAVEVDGKRVGNTGETIELPVCAKELRAVGPDGRAWTRSLELKEAKLSKLEGKLPAPGPSAGERVEGFLGSLGKGERKSEALGVGFSYRYGDMEVAAFHAAMRKDGFGVRAELGLLRGAAYKDMLDASGSGSRSMYGFAVEVDPDALPMYLGFQYMKIGGIHDSAVSAPAVDGYILYVGRRFKIFQVEAGALQTEDRAAWRFFAAIGLDFRLE